MMLKAGVATASAPVLVDVRTYPTKVIDDTVYIEVP